MTMLDTVKLSDAQIILWACINMYQFADTKEETLEIVRFFVEHIGIVHSFPNVEDRDEVDENSKAQELVDSTENTERASKVSVSSIANAPKLDDTEVKAILDAIKGMKR